MRIFSYLSVFTQSVIVFVGVVVILYIIETISVFMNEWLEHLMRHLILLILGCWLQTSWSNWVDLCQSLVSNLSVLSECVIILIWVIVVLNIVESISVFMNDGLQHLVRHFILHILGWWLKASWSNWINLSQNLFTLINSYRIFSECLISNLNIFTESMVILIRVVIILDIIIPISVLMNDWFEHLVNNLVLLILGRWLKTCRVDWVNLKQ